MEVIWLKRRPIKVSTICGTKASAKLYIKKEAKRNTPCILFLNEDDLIVYLAYTMTCSGQLMSKISVPGKSGTKSPTPERLQGA